MPRICLPDSLRRCLRRLAHLVFGRVPEPADLPVSPAPGTRLERTPTLRIEDTQPTTAPQDPSAERIALRRRLSFGGPIVSAITGEEIQPSLSVPAPPLPPPPYYRVSEAEYIHSLAEDESLPDPPDTKGKRREATLQERFRELKEPAARYQTRSRTRQCASPSGPVQGSVAPA
jgi:hypothetical protein